jgi:hypothetical protein
MTSILSEPIVWRGVERLGIIVGAIFFGWLGFQLYKLGLSSGASKLDVKSPLIRFAMSGTGPGLLFMAFGALVLIFSLATGGAHLERKSNQGAKSNTNVVFTLYSPSTPIYSLSNSSLSSLTNVLGFGWETNLWSVEEMDLHNPGLLEKVRRRAIEESVAAKTNNGAALH